MITKKPRKGRTCSSAKKGSSKKRGEINASLPTISDESIRCDDFLKIPENIEKIPRVVIPKIKIRCEPLNVEKVIDLLNSKVVHEGKIINPPQKKSMLTETVTCKTTKLSGGLKISKILPQNKKPVQRKKKIQDDNLKSYQNDKRNKKTTIKLVLKNPQLKQASTQASTPQKPEQQSGTNLNCKFENSQGVCCPYPSNMENVTNILEVNDINLEDLQPFMDALPKVDFRMKVDEKGNERSKNAWDMLNDSNILSNSFVHASPSRKTNDLDKWKQDLSNINKTSLQVAVESFMNNPQLPYLRESAALKMGLCFSWITNNQCVNQHCLYSHNAVNSFLRKMKQFPSKFIMTLVVSMRNDSLFPDAVLASFKIITERKLPLVWVTFLIFFVFYVTEPSDSRFLKFWVNAARFFCQLSENYAAASGFASLLSIFVQTDKSEEWKIIEFIKIIRQPPVEVSTNFALLQPVLKLAIPPEFLAEAVKSCTVTQKDVLKVYSLIIPKIPITTSPLRLIELLLKFCETLELTNHKIYADDLKLRLQEKVRSFRTKINRQYPLTASLQEALLLANEENCIAAPVVVPKAKSNPDLENVATEINFFQLEDDFYTLMNQAIELSPNDKTSPCKEPLKPNGIRKISNNSEEDICERQVNRIKQFFHDCQFDLLAKYLNELRPNVIERAAEEFLKLLFNMKITLQQSVDLIKIIILPSKSENSAKVIASICVTLILNLVRINEWEKAFTILSLCRERQINLLEGKVFYFNELNTITQCRITLLFIEIYSYKDDYVSAVDLVKKNFLYSPNNSLWKLTWKAYDEIVRVKILENLLENIISKQLTETAFNLFEMIWREQKQLFGCVDLRKFINEILILLLNHNSEQGVTLYNKIKAEVQFVQITVRAILVTLFRSNRLIEAKSLFLSPNQTAYPHPEILFNSTVIKVLSFWLEEEIYVMFDAFFDFLATNKHGLDLISNYNFEIQIQISKPNITPAPSFRPLCLGIINPTFKDACTRIQRVLQYQFNPPLKLIIKPYCLELDEHSVKLHLQKRMSQNSE